MKKGDGARAFVASTIEEAFRSLGLYVTTQDKKIYVNAQDGAGGEVLQLAISMTIPKTPIGKPAVNGVVSGEGAFPATPVATPTQLSAEDQAAVQDLMNRLGVS